MSTTDIIAIYAAALATAVAAYNGFVAWKARRPDVKVTVWPGRVGLPTGGWSEPMIFVEAVNSGRKPTTLKMVGFILPTRERLVVPRPLPAGYVVFPFELLVEKACKAATPAAELAKGLKAQGFTEKVSLIGYFDDEVGRRYKSKPAIFDTNDERLVSGFQHKPTETPSVKRE